MTITSFVKTFWKHVNKGMLVNLAKYILLLQKSAWSIILITLSLVATKLLRPLG